MIVKNVYPPADALTYELAVSKNGTGNSRAGEVGSEGTNAFYGHVSETYTSKLEWPDAYDVYNEMRRRDPTLRSALNVVSLLARQSTIKAEPASDKPADRQAGDFLQECLEDTSHTVEDFLDDVLSFLPFGWSSFEVALKRRSGTGGQHKSMFDDGRIGWRKFAFRRQSTLSRWDFDDHGGFAGWYQVAPPAYEEVFLPIDKLLHFVAHRDGNNPEGFCLFESLYEPWHYVKNLQIINGIGWQRTFVGLPVFGFAEGSNPSADDKAQVRQVGEGLTVDEKQYVSVPPGIDFRLESTANSGAKALLDTITEYRVMMLRLFLAEFLAVGTGSTGSRALHTDKSELFIMAVNGYLDKIVAVLNRFAVPRLFEFESNRFAGVAELPRITHTEVRKPNLDELGEFIQKIAPYITLGDEDELWIRDQAGMPETMPEEDDDNEPPDNEPETGTEDDEPEMGKYAGLIVELAEFEGRDDERAQIEAALESTVDDFLTGQEERVVAAAQGGSNPGDNDTFWDAEKAALLAVLVPALTKHIQTLFGYTIEDTEAIFKISADWGLVNEAALKWAREFAGSEVTYINDTTRRGVRQAVANWIETGGTLEDLVDTLEPTFGRNRARRIAATEVTQAFAEGNIRAWTAAGIADREPEKRPIADSHIGCRCWLIIQPKGKRWVYQWQTAADEAVCPICSPLDGREVGTAREGLS